MVLTIHKPLPTQKKLTGAVEEHWKSMLYAAIAKVAQQKVLSYFVKAFVEIQTTPQEVPTVPRWPIYRCSICS